jgi:N-acetylmuramoyl-L-alanine amidase
MKAMRPLLLLVSCLICAHAGVATGAPSPRTETAEFGGKRYVRIGDWGRANGFELHWLKRDESLQLSNRAARLVFTKDSRQAEVNGVNVWLSYPIVINNGGGYLAEADIETAIRPVLSPPKNWSRIKTIVIDPGHGGRDPGFQDGTRQEKKYTLLLAEELCEQLKRAGFKASLTRTTDSYIDLPERPDIARRRKADLFISLHWNSAGSVRRDVKGVETYCLTPAGAPSTNAGHDLTGAELKTGNRNNDKNLFLAYELQKSLVKSLGLEDRGLRRARFAVLSDAEMPAVLIEGGFMSHPTESRRIYDPVYRQKMAKSIVDGITAYEKQVDPPVKK